MLPLGRDVDSHFVFLHFFSPNMPEKATSWAGQCSHVWVVLGSGWEPPVLQLPAPTPDVELGPPTPGTGVALAGVLSLLQMLEQRTNHPWLCFCALTSSAIPSSLGFPRM